MSADELKPANKAEVAKATGTVAVAEPAEAAAQAPKPSKRSLPIKKFVVATVLAGVAALGAWYAVERFWPEPEVLVAPPVVEKGHPEKLAIDSIAFQRQKPLERSKPEAKLAAPSSLPSKPASALSYADLDALAKQQLDPRKAQYHFIADTPSEATSVPETLPPQPASQRDVIPLPSDRRLEVEAKSPSEYPASGQPPRYYFVLLRNLLHRPESARLDLEKAYILLSMYYNPDLDPAVYRTAFRELASELKHRLTVAGPDGNRVPITDGHRQAAIISEFMTDGGGPFKGWDVQEYHPGITGAGVPLAEQNFLVDQVLARGARARNTCSNTALNLLTLILVRKVMEPLAGEGSSVNDAEVMVPLYGVRLPDRTILRYDHAAPDLPLPDEEPSTFERYTRNIEYLRNGNHYSGADYVRRYRMSDSDRARGIYLYALRDKAFFATLGYELARTEIERGTPAGFKRAEMLLEEWVLDRDRVSMGIADDPDRILMPRGDPNLRDALILSAEMRLTQGDFAGIQRQVEENQALHATPDRVDELRGMIKRHQGYLESARAFLEDALARNPDNPRAHLYLGDISFLLDQGLGTARGAESVSSADVSRADVSSTLASCLEHFDIAEKNGRGRLSGSEEFLLHYHRALARKRAGQFLAAIRDMERVAKINPDFSRTPAYDGLNEQLRRDRAFAVLEAPSSEEPGEVKFQAVGYLDSVLRLDPMYRADLIRTAKLFGSLDNLAVEWELLSVLSRMTGQNFGRNPQAWSDWFRKHFEATR